MWRHCIPKCGVDGQIGDKILAAKNRFRVHAVRHFLVCGVGDAIRTLKRSALAGVYLDYATRRGSVV